MKYQQLTEGQRYQIAALRDEGLAQVHIAKTLGVHPSTISRELKRNRNEQGYQPRQAHQQAMAKRAACNKYSIPADTVIYVHMTLAADWSPEQISEVGNTIDCPVSHEWIYRHVAQDKANGGKQYREKLGHPPF